MNNNIYFYYIFYWIYIHLIVSNIEYIGHRFIMHSSNNIYGDAHLNHHKNTDKNMTLMNRERLEYKENGTLENLIFEPLEMTILLILVYCFSYLFYIFTPVKLNIYFIVLLPFIYYIYVLMIWNSIHPYIHKKCGRDYTIVSLPCNIIEYMVKNSSFLQWLIENHKKHHIYKGDKKGNWNVSLPGADFIYNTYN